MFELYTFECEYLDFSTANLYFILGSKSDWGVSRRLLKLKLLLTHPKFLHSCHGWNFSGSSGSVELPQLLLPRFTQCDPASAITVCNALASESDDVCVSGQREVPEERRHSRGCSSSPHPPPFLVRPCLSRRSRAFASKNIGGTHIPLVSYPIDLLAPNLQLPP